MDYWLQECPACLYCAYRIEAADLVGRAREIINSPDYLFWTSRLHPSRGVLREVVRGHATYQMSEDESQRPFESFPDGYFHQSKKPFGIVEFYSDDYMDWKSRGWVQHRFSRFRRLALIGALNGVPRQQLDGLIWSAWYADDQHHPWSDQAWPQVARDQRKRAIDVIGSPSDEDLRQAPPIMLLDLMRRAEEWRMAETLAARAVAVGTNYAASPLNKPEIASACLEFETALITARNTACYTAEAAVKYASSKVIPPPPARPR